MGLPAFSLFILQPADIQRQLSADVIAAADADLFPLVSPAKAPLTV